MHASGPTLDGALVQVLEDRSGLEVYRTTADHRGQFALEDIRVGVYLVRFSADGFLDKKAPAVVSAGRTTNLGDVALDGHVAMRGCPLDCDAPGADCFMACISIAGQPPIECHHEPPVLKTGHLAVKRGCGADVDHGTVVCDSDSKVDFIVRPGENGWLYIRPANGAQTAPVNAPDGAPYSDKPIRVDGLGTCNSFWLHTASGLVYSHLFITKYMERDAPAIDLWYVNRAHPR
jgi:hypothetical protein